MTKKQQGLLNNYRWCYSHYGARRLDDVYTKCSVAKRRAWDEIFAEYCKNNGHGLALVSYNCMTFSAAYVVTDPKTEKSSLIYHTAYNKYIIPID